MTNKLKVLSLFSGVGMFDFGLEQTGGFETVAFCEIDKDCQKVLKKHWSNTTVFNNICDLSSVHVYDGENYLAEGCLEPSGAPVNEQWFDKIDVICGGFPCQDLSVAGNQKGLIDEKGEATRSGLWFQYKRLIKEIQPKYVLIENVPNLLNKGFATVLQDLHELGYDAEWGVISARAVGANHLRKRIWIIAYPISIRNRRDSIKLGETISDSEEQEIWTSFECEGKNNERIRECKQRDSSTVLQPTNPSSQRSLQYKRQSKTIQSNRNQGLQRKEGEQSSMSELIYSDNQVQHPNPNNLRLWRPFTSEEEKSQWWAKATAKFRSWWAAEPPVCGVDDGCPEGLDQRQYERERKARIKQLGNGLVPQIAQLIGQCILDYEKEN